MKHSLTKIFCIDPCVIKNAFLLLHPLSEGSARGGAELNGEKKNFGVTPCAGRKKLLPLQPCSEERGAERKDGDT